MQQAIAKHCPRHPMAVKPNAAALCSRLLKKGVFCPPTDHVVSTSNRAFLEGFTEVWGHSLIGTRS